MPLTVVATKPVTIRRPVEPRRHQTPKIRLARRPLNRGPERAPFDDHDFAGVDPQDVALDAAPRSRRNGANRRVDQISP